MCCSTVSQRGRFRFRSRFLENGSGGSGSTFGSCENGSDGSGFRFRVRFLGHPAPHFYYAVNPLLREKLEKAGTVDFKKHPARKVGTRSQECQPKVRGRFAFPSARNPRICSISRFGNNFPAIFPGLSRSFPREPLNRRSLLEFSNFEGRDVCSKIVSSQGGSP